MRLCSTRADPPTVCFSPDVDGRDGECLDVLIETKGIHGRSPAAATMMSDVHCGSDDLGLVCYNIYLISTALPSYSEPSKLSSLADRPVNLIV